MTMLNYFVDVGTNTNYDCFNTYLGKYYNKTKLDCLEQFLWEQQELKAELQYKLQEHPDSRVAVYDAFVRANREKDPVTLAQALIDTHGCGQPEHLFMALYTVTEHRKEIEHG